MDSRLKDKHWRVNNLYKIVDKNADLIKFRLNAVQKKFDKEKHTRNIILKARQLGISTYECVDILDDVLFNKNFTAVIIAQDKESVKKIFKKVRLAWEHFDPELKAFIGFKENTDSTNELSFTHGSSVRVATSSRADTVNRLHISEFGKICAKYPSKAEEIITGAFPSVPAHGRIDIESTAEGEFGKFHEMFWDAWEVEPLNQKEFKAFFFPWTLEPKYMTYGEYPVTENILEYGIKHKLSKEQVNWYFIEKRTLKGKMKQENPTTPEEAFESSGNKLFDDPESIDHQEQFIEEGRKVGNWTIFEDPKPHHRYALGADVAHGKGLDSSTCSIWDFSELEPVQVAEYASNTIAPDLFAYEIKKGAEMFNNCHVAVENNDRGYTTLVELRRIYHNIYVKEIKNKLTDKVTEELGWNTNVATKPKMMFDFKTALEDKIIKIKSKFLLKEIRTYDESDLTKIKFDEEMTTHWDRLIAAEICWQMKDKAEYVEEDSSTTFSTEDYD